MLLRFLCALVLIIGIGSASEEFVIVHTENGPLRGEHRGLYYAFEGIPYAKAPVQELRLAPSEINDARWVEPRNVTKPGPMCLQWNHFVEGDDRSIGEEDCLFMNIYTTSFDEDLPTIFFIHGGAFMFGNGDYYYPDNLLTRPLVLVTFNYRLGPLGFLSTEDDVIPGNFGLKDQVTALEWVRRNIANFGGDASSITLAGFSAGSASVQLHYFSPMSRGLFVNGIGHSGAVLNPWVMVENSSEKAKIIATGVGCSTTSSEKMLKCLRQKPARDIVRAVAPLFDFLYNPFSPLGVVVETLTEKNPNPFLVEHPYELMKMGYFYRVPLLLSVSDVEGLYPGGEFISNKQYLNEINDNWNELLPSILDYQTTMQNEPSRRDEISQMIRKRYLGDDVLSDNNFGEFLRILTNRLYFAGIAASAKLMQSFTPVYLYYNKYKTQYSVGEFMTKSLKNYGVAHGEDVFLVFKSEMRDEIPYSDEELLVAGLFAEMYERFARRNVAQFGDTEIPRSYRQDMIRYLELDYPKIEAKLALELDDEGFWNRLDFGDGKKAERPVKTEL